jgi:hypothetical protein
MVVPAVVTLEMQVGRGELLPATGMGSPVTVTPGGSVTVKPLLPADVVVLTLVLQGRAQGQRTNTTSQVRAAHCKCLTSRRATTVWSSTSCPGNRHHWRTHSCSA